MKVSSSLLFASQAIYKRHELNLTWSFEPARLTQLRRSLQEKLDVLMTLDSEIVNLVDERSVAVVAT